MKEKREWDLFLLRVAPGALFQSWQWGDVELAVGEKMWRFGIYEKDHLAGIFQVARIGARRGTFLHVRHGPVLPEFDGAVFAAFTDFIADLAKRQHAWFVRISPLIDPTVSHEEHLKSLGYQRAPIHAMDGERCWVLDLAKSDEELLAAMRKTTRYEIRHAQRLGVTVRQSSDRKDLPAFLKLYAQTASRHEFVPHQGIAEEFTIFGKNNSTRLFLGYYEKQLVAGAMILFYGNQAIYHHGASRSGVLPAGRQVPASSLVQWEAIKEAKRRGMGQYNFWGIAPEDAPNHPWQGLTLFKKGFGGEERQTIHAHDLPVSPFYRIPRAIETYRRWRKGY